MDHPNLPIRVGLMDDDFAALKWNAALLSRDVRTCVCLEAESPAELLAKLDRNAELDVLLLDTEYFPQEPPLGELISKIHTLQPAIPIVCLSQYGEKQFLQAALQCRARGFLLKSEVRMAVGSAVTLALRSDFLISSGMLPQLGAQQMLPRGRLVQINTWVDHPALTPQLKQVFTLRILYGMSAPLAAKEIHLAPATVEKYIQHTYQKLSQHWGDERLLEGVEMEQLPAEAWAFHLYTLPPAR